MEGKHSLTKPAGYISLMGQLRFVYIAKGFNFAVGRDVNNCRDTPTAPGLRGFFAIDTSAMFRLLLGVIGRTIRPLQTAHACWATFG